MLLCTTLPKSLRSNYDFWERALDGKSVTETDVQISNSNAEPKT